MLILLDSNANTIKITYFKIFIKSLILIKNIKYFSKLLTDSWYIFKDNALFIFNINIRSIKQNKSVSLDP